MASKLDVTNQVNRAVSKLDDQGETTTPSGILELTQEGARLADVSGNMEIQNKDGLTILSLDSVEMAENNLVITNAPSGSSPVLSVEGSALNISLELVGKGTGSVVSRSLIDLTSLDTAIPLGIAVNSPIVPNLKASYLGEFPPSYYLDQANFSGVLSTSQGGTGSSSYLPNEIIVSDGTGSSLVSSGSKLSDYSLTAHDHDGVYSLISHNHSGVYEPIDITILRESNVRNNLASTSIVNPLSANMGRVLQETKSDISHNHDSDYSAITHNHDGIYEPIDSSILRTSNVVDALTSTTVLYPLSANQGRILDSLKAPKVNPTFTGVVTADTITSSVGKDLVLSSTSGRSVKVLNDSGEGLLVNSLGNTEVTQDLTVHGNFTVLGDSTVLKTTNLEVEDQFIEVNKATVIVDQDSGMHIKRTDIDASLIWDHSNSYWAAGLVGAEIKLLLETDVVDNLSSQVANRPLSANMGWYLDQNKSDINHNHDADYSDINHNHDGVYEPVDATLLRQSDVVDNLTSTAVVYPLSAKQGKTLSEGKADKVSGAVAGNLASLDVNGNLLDSNVDPTVLISDSQISLNSSKIIYVDKNKTGTYVEDGSIHKPFKRVSDAYAAASHFATILVAPGEYNEILNFSSALQDITISGTSTSQGNGTKILGKVYLNSTLGRTHFKDLVIRASNGSPALDILECNGATFENVNIGHTVLGGTAPVLFIGGSTSEAVVFDSCIINNHGLGIKVQSSVNRQVSFLNCPVGANLELSSTNTSTVIVKNCEGFGEVTQHKGSLFIKSSSITSLTSDSINPYFLVLVNSSLRSIDNSTLGTITKTGTSPYLIGDNDSIPYEKSSFTGTSLGYTSTSDNSYYTKSEWLVENVKEALDSLKDDLDSLKFIETYYIDSVEGSDSDGDGSLNNPLKTIQAAIDYTPTLNKVILLTRGEHTQSVTFNSHSYIHIEGLGSKFSTVLRCASGVTPLSFTGASNNITVANVFVESTNAPAVSFNNSDGTIRFVDSWLSRTDPLVGNTVEFLNAPENNFEFINTDIDGGLNLGGNLASKVNVTVKGNRSAQLKPVVGNINYTLNLLDCDACGKITQTTGNLLLRNIKSITPEGGVALSSVAGISNFLHIHKTNFQQVAGAYGSITKTGMATWIIENSNTNVDRTSLSGVRSNYAEWAVDISAGFTPSYYSSSNDSVESHLKAIDNILSFDTVGTANAVPDTVVRRDLNAGFAANILEVDQIKAKASSSLLLLDSTGEGLTVHDGGLVVASQDFQIKGNLIVEGNQTVINTANLEVEDQFIEINKGVSIVDQDSGIYVKRTTTDASIMWNHLDSEWKAGLAGGESKILLEADVINNLTSTSTVLPLSALQGKLLQDNKANKVSGATAGNIASLDVNGDLVDSGRTFSDFEAVDSTILRTSDVIDNLTSTSSVYPLSANQGRILDTLKAPKDNPIFTGVVTANAITSFVGSPLVIQGAVGQSTSLLSSTDEGLIIASDGTATFSQQVVIEGGLVVNGTTTTINSIELSVEDPFIELNKSDTVIDQDSGLYIKRTTTDATLFWDNTSSHWVAGVVGDSHKILLSTDVIDNLTSTSVEFPLSANQGKILDEAKANKVSGDVGGHVASLDVEGDLVDSGLSTSELIIGSDVGLNGSKTLYVDKHRSNTYVEDGSYLRPFKTIASALIASSANNTIIISTGIYTENIIIPGSLSGLTIKGTGGTFRGSNTVIQGFSTVTDVTDLRLEDLTLNYTTDDTNPTLLISGNTSTGSHRYHNVSIKRTHSSENSRIAVRVEGDLTGELIFDNTHVEGIFENSSISSSNFPVRIEGVISNSFYMQNKTSNAVTVLHACSRIGHVVHEDGTLVLSNIGTVLTDGSGNCIVSTAPSSSNAILVLKEASFLQDDFITYGKINKTGSCRWIIKDCNRKSSIDILTGTRDSYAAFPVDHGYIKTGWAVNNVKEALDHLQDNKSDIVHSHTSLDNATPNATPGTLVLRDANADFATNKITALEIASPTNSSLSLTNDSGVGIDVFDSGDVRIEQNLTVGGNLVIEGDSTSIQTSTLSVEDHFIELGLVATPTDATADGGGILLKGDTDKTIQWIAGTGSWTFSENLDLIAGKDYKIGTTSVLSSTTLGQGVLYSSLTKVGSEIQLGNSGLFIKDNAGILEVLDNSGTTLTSVKVDSLESTTVSVAPFTVASNLLVSNLNSDLLDGQEGSYYLDSINHSYTKTGWVGITTTAGALNSLKDELTSIASEVNSGTSSAVPNTLVKRDGDSGFSAGILELEGIKANNASSLTVFDSSGNGLTIADGGEVSSSNSITAPVFISNISTGTAPIEVSSSTLVNNLNADLLDGLHASAFELADSTLLRQSDVVDNLISTSTIYPLSANQGKLLFNNTGINSSGVLFVDKNRTEVFASDGSVLRPYKTVGDALASVSSSQTIVIYPGEYSEDITIPSTLSNISIKALGGKSVKLLGKFIVNGSKGFSIEGVTLESTSTVGSDFAFSVIGSGIEDLLVLNCRLLRSNNPATDVAVKIESVNAGQVVIKDSYIQGSFNNSSSSSSGTAVILDNCWGQFLRVLVDSPTTETIIKDSSLIGSITHISGKLYLSRIKEISSVGVVSTAVAGVGNNLHLNEVSMVSSGIYLPINKSGDCDYTFEDVDRDSSIDTIGAGSTKSYGRRIEDILADYTPVNYSALSTGNTKSHLVGIDAALGLSTSATPENIANTIVKRDGGGSFKTTSIELTSISSPEGSDITVVESTGLGLTISDVTGEATFDSTVEAVSFSSTVTTGTSPFSILSSTLVTNLNADQLDNQEGTYYLNSTNHAYSKVGWVGITSTSGALDDLKDQQEALGNNAVLRDGTTPLTANWDAGPYSISATSFKARSGASVKFVNSSGQGMTVTNTGDANFSQNVTIAGNLTVDGGNTTIASATLEVEDQNIVMGNVAAPTDATAAGGGITLKGAVDKTISWANDTNENWTSSENFNLAVGRVYRINNVEVLSYTSLGSTVTSSNLQSVGVVSSGTWEANIIEMAYGGTGKALVPSEGGIVYSGASNMEILSSTLDSNKMLLSGPSTAPKWSNYSMPNTVAQGDLLFGSATTTISTLTKGLETNKVLMNTGTNNNPEWATIDAEVIAVTSSVHQATNVEDALEDSVMFTEIITYSSLDGFIELSHIPVTRSSIHITQVSGVAQINWDTPGRATAGVLANYWMGDLNKKRVYFDSSSISNGDTDPGVTFQASPADGISYLVVYSAVRGS